MGKVWLAILMSAIFWIAAWASWNDAKAFYKKHPELLDNPYHGFWSGDKSK